MASQELHDQIVALLQKNYYGTHWVLTDDTYNGLVWMDDPATKPTAAQLGL